MSRSLTLTVDPSAFSIAAAIRTAARSAPLFVLTGRALGDLAAELGTMDAAANCLLEVAESIGRPVGVNVPTGPDTSSTAFVAPSSWTAARLAGWVAGHREILEAEFGMVTLMGRHDGRRLWG